MPTVNISESLHARAKRLALDAGTTLGQLVHDGLERILDETEKKLAELKKKTKAGKAKTNPKVQ
jgi:hypothetical protein